MRTRRLRPYRISSGGTGRIVTAKGERSRGRVDGLLDVPDRRSPAGPSRSGSGARNRGAVTSRLRIGTIVFNNDLRHPAVLAQDLATLDLLSEGRLEIDQATAGKSRSTRAWLSFDQPPVRFERMRESMAVLKGLLGEGTFSFAGRHYQIHEMDGLPKPWQRPHPPFLIGGGGRRMLDVRRPRSADCRPCTQAAPAPRPDTRQLHGRRHRREGGVDPFVPPARDSTRSN